MAQSYVARRQRRLPTLVQLLRRPNEPEHTARSKTVDGTSTSGTRPFRRPPRVSRRTLEAPLVRPGSSPGYVDRRRRRSSSGDNAGVTRCSMAWQFAHTGSRSVVGSTV